MAAAASPSHQDLRASLPHLSAQLASTAGSSQDIPDINEPRSLQDAQIPQRCLDTLAASANDNGNVKKENYFVFTDGMANGYYSYNNISSYSDMPMTNKFGFVALSCACQLQGGSSNCCTGNRAKLDVAGIDPENPSTMPDELYAYIMDICKVTIDSIGDSVLPPTGELPTTADPTSSPTVDDLGDDTESTTLDPLGDVTESNTLDPLGTTTKAPTKKPTSATTDDPNRASIDESTDTESPTASPVAEEITTVESPPIPDESNASDGTDGADGQTHGLNPGAIAGIALAWAFVAPLAFYIYSKRKNKDDGDESDSDHLMDNMSQRSNGKKLLTIADGCDDEESSFPADTIAMTHSDVSSIPSMENGLSKSSSDEQNEYYANNNLLPRDSESELSSIDGGPSFFNGDDINVDGSVEVLNPRVLNMSSSSSDNLDDIIESGNWKAVAASAAANISRNTEFYSLSSLD